MDAKQELIEAFQQSINEDSFVKLTIANPRTGSQDLQKVTIKLFLRREQKILQYVYSNETQDLTQNYALEDAAERISDLLEKELLSASLLTIKHDYHFRSNQKGSTHLSKGKPSVTEIPERQHDHQKEDKITNRSFLQGLDILDHKGQIKKDKGSKLKQIQKFVAIIESLIRQNKNLFKDNDAQVLDMGSGKGYLTFALYDFLVNKLKFTAQVTGIEQRKDLVKLGNRVAVSSGFKDLIFSQGTIADCNIETPDILMALHACDTATDDAIFKGIQAGAKIIICSPCCHKQVRKSMSDDGLLKSIKMHGILKERQAEIATDAIRALLLESKGYETKVFEFISMEHTGKNLMITAIRKNKNVAKEAFLKEVKVLKSTLEIKEHYLENLLYPSKK